MPWTKSDYPDSMKNLPAEVRNKAIDIANALLEEDMNEGIAIATAISRAKDWAANRGKKTENPEKSRISDVKKHGQDRYVIPYEGSKWAIKVEGQKKIETVFPRKKDAVSKAREEAKEVNGALTIQKKTGQVEKRISYNPNRRAVKQTR
ncbi:MAG TPA: DUF2188 domain-containing protein [Bacteroidales bacterium]|nr:DUF2188 domain-containing protein [Bacteroidales bacterium]